MKAKILFTVIIGLSACCNAVAQYYHKDLLANKQANAERALLKEKKIREVLVHAFEPDGTATEGFNCEKKISRDYDRIEATTQTTDAGKSVLTTFFNSRGLIGQTTDSSDLLASTSFYEYDAEGRLVSIRSTSHSSDEDFSTSLSEERRYYYNSNGQPEKMIRTKGSANALQVDFIVDAKGHVTDEIERAPGGQHYYYYHDSSNRLTDVVRFNEVRKALRADFAFEYDEDGNLVQMTTVDDGASGDYTTWRYNQSNYVVWKYFYLDGLRIIEKCFSKEKKLMGYIEYEYKE
jgi:YD repeat-containing protein